MSQKTLNEDLNVLANSDLEITYLDGDLNIIQKLDDEPNDVGGLTSAELKAKFDEAGNIIKGYINETLIPEILASDATEEARETAESERETAEAERVAAESERASAEAARATAEAARVLAEDARSNTESARTAAETARISTEEARTEAEKLRTSAESTRSEAEKGRVTAESERTTAETTRIQNEAGRVQAEQQRVAAEAQRVAAEASRAAADAARNVWEGYSSTKAYAPGNKVSYWGSSYLNVAPCTGVAPTDTAHWLLIAAKGVDGTGFGDMLQSVYDSNKIQKDIFQYVDDAVSNLSDALDENTSNVNTLDSRVGEIENTITSIEETLDGNISDVSALSTRVGSIETDVESVSGDVSALNTKVGQIEDDVAAAQTALLACGNCQIYYGTYVGKGSGSTDLTFPKKPLFVSIMGNNIWITAIQGAPVGIGKNAGTLNYGYNAATWSGNSLSLANNSSHMASQCNSSGTTYYVVALMDAST